MKLQENYAASSVVTCQLCLILGASQGFSEIILSELRDLKLPTHINHEEQQTSWMAIMQTFCTPLGIITEGILIDKVGRKKTLQAVSVFFILSWAFTALSSDSTFMHVSRFCLSFTSGMIFSTILYVAEISPPHHRGTLLSLITPAHAFGTLFVYILNSLLPSEVIALILTIYSSFVFFSLRYLPESHIWHMLKNQREKATCILLLLRENDLDVTHNELDMIQKRISLYRGEGMKNYLLNFLKPTVWKPFVVFFFFFLFEKQTGYIVIISYPAIFFNSLGSEINDNSILHIIPAFIAVVGSIALAFIIHKFNRKMLLMGSGAGMTLTMAVAATTLTYTNDVSFVWLRMTCIFIYMFFYTFAMISVPWMIIGKVFPNHLRGVMTAVVTIITFVIAFIHLQFYPFLQENIKTEGVLWYFCLFSLLTTMFVHLFIPETKSKTLSEIEKHFEHKF